MPRISWEQMARYPLAVPPESRAAEFTAQVGAWVEVIIHNIAETQILARTRDYLLPKLLSGEIEVHAKTPSPQRE
jgi:type I restriction enzyme S subunit